MATTRETLSLPEIAEILTDRNDGGRLLGIQTAEDIAPEWTWCWTRQGLIAWLDAGCWDGERTRELAEHGVRPEDLSGDEGYDHSNGDVSTGNLMARIAVRARGEG